MNDAQRVRRTGAGRYLAADVQRVAERETVSRQPVSQRLAVDVFHRDEAPPVRHLTQREDRADVRMAQRRCAPGFLLEPGDAMGIVGEFRRQHLERDAAAQAQLACQVHLAHPSRAEE